MTRGEELSKKKKGKERNGCSCKVGRVELLGKCDAVISFRVYEENIVSTRKITSFTKQSVILKGVEHTSASQFLDYVTTALITSMERKLISRLSQEHACFAIPQHSRFTIKHFTRFMTFRIFEKSKQNFYFNFH